MEIIKWDRPSGRDIETNDLKETVKYCLSLGWKIKSGFEEEKPKKVEEEVSSEEEKPKRGRPKKVTEEVSSEEQD